jgi:hypothetical protein
LISLIHPLALEEMLYYARKTPDGAFVEVGVYQGGSAIEIDKIAREQGRECFLYDTFTGIPYQGEYDSCKVGDFADTSYEIVRDKIPHAHVVKGVFPCSAVSMPPVAFLHLDCDQYQSFKDALTYMVPKMVKGGLIWLDDVGLEGARMAAKEVFPYLLYSENHRGCVWM